MFDRIKNRMQGRKLRRQLSDEQKAYVDRISPDIWKETKDVGEAERITRLTVEHEGPSLGFDPATIVLLVQLAVAIYQALKHLNVLAPTPELVAELFEGEDDD